MVLLNTEVEDWACASRPMKNMANKANRLAPVRGIVEKRMAVIV